MPMSPAECAAFACPLRHRAVRVRHIEVEPDMRIHPLDPDNYGVQQDQRGVIFGGEGMVRLYRRRGREQQARQRNTHIQLHVIFYSIPSNVCGLFIGPGVATLL